VRLFCERNIFESILVIFKLFFIYLKWKRKKGVNFTKAEINLLIDIILKYKHIVDYYAISQALHFFLNKIEKFCVIPLLKIIRLSFYIEFSFLKISSLDSKIFIFSNKSIIVVFHTATINFCNF